MAALVSGCINRHANNTYEYNGAIFTFASIPKGEFMMGSPENEPHRCPGWWSSNETQHNVVLTRNYLLGITEVTQKQWKTIMKWLPYSDSLHCNVCWHDTCRIWKINFKNDIGDDKPITGIKYREASAFCDSLSRIFNKKFRLPTEAEWEYACRANAPGLFYFGDDTSILKKYAVYGRAYGNNENVRTLLPNKWGLFDMHGNVWEWVSDYYGNFPVEAQTDPSGPAAPDTLFPKWPRTLRGGCSVNDAFQLRNACRHRIEEDFCNSVVGFRILVEL